MPDQSASCSPTAYSGLALTFTRTVTLTLTRTLTLTLPAPQVGLVLANCLNMLVRIAYAHSYVRRSCAAARASDPAAAVVIDGMRLYPPPLVIGALVGSAALTSATALVLGTPSSPPAHHACHVVVGAVCLLAVVGAVARAEPALVTTLQDARRKRRVE